MFRIFYKSLLNIFLWIILIANLYLFFNITSPFTARVIPFSTHNYYFGVSSFIDAIKYIPNSTMGRIASRINTWLNTMSTLTTMTLEYGWVGFINSINNIVNASGQEKILQIARMIFSLLRTGITTIVSMVIGMSLIFLAFAWFTFTLLSLIEWFYMMTGGQFAKHIPTTYIGGVLNTLLLDFAVWGV